jgi:hypothetical protein
MVTDFKGVQHSDETIKAEHHLYTVMSGHFKAPADLHRKRNPCYVLNRKLVGPRGGLEEKKKKIFLPRGCDLCLLSCPARYVVTGTTETWGPVLLLMLVKPSQDLCGFVNTDVHCITSAGEGNGPQRRVRTGTLLTYYSYCVHHRTQQ